MGNKSSKLNYKLNKNEFDEKIVILQDSIDLAHFYATELSNQVMPIKLTRYQNYNEKTEEYFNTTRKDNNIELLNQNAKTRNLYDFYIQLTLLPKEYENPNSTELDKRNLIKLIFTTSYNITKMLLSELTENDLYKKE
jgi:hypothetical protein